MSAAVPAAWSHVSYQRPHSAAPNVAASQSLLSTYARQLACGDEVAPLPVPSDADGIERGHHHRPKSADVGSSTKGASSMDTWVLKRQLQRLTQPFASHFFWKRRECVEEETSARCTLLRDMMEASGFLFSTTIALQEGAYFREICSQRKEEAFAPWCSQGCRYCCTHRLLWADHSTQLWVGLNRHLQQQESVTRNSLESGLLHEMNGLYNYFQANARAHDLLAAHQTTMEAEWRHVATIITLNEERCFRTELMDVKDRLLADWKAECYRTELENRERGADRQAESATVSFHRAMRQTSFCMREHETEQRRGLLQRELNERVDLRARMETQGSSILQQQWRVENSDVFDELRRLRQFKADAETAQRRAEEDRVAAIRAEWAKELQEIKRLKKQGPPKGQQVLPPCARCGQPPAKDEFTHRVQECIERPVSCPKCTEVMPFSRLEGHKSLCPQRIVQCSSCLHFYKAAYLEGPHRVYCAALPEMARLMKSTGVPMSTSGERPLWRWLPTLPCNTLQSSLLHLPLRVVREFSASALPPPISSFVTPAPTIPFAPSSLAPKVEECCCVLTHVGSVRVSSWADVHEALDNILRNSAAPALDSSVEDVLSVVSPPQSVACSFAPLSPDESRDATVVTEAEGDAFVAMSVSLNVVPMLAPSGLLEVNGAHCCCCCQLVDHSTGPPMSEGAVVPAAIELLLSAGGAAGSQLAFCHHHTRWMNSIVASDVAQYCKPAIERKAKKR
jgi:hypothetical protein